MRITLPMLAVIAACCGGGFWKDQWKHQEPIVKREYAVAIRKGCGTVGRVLCLQEGCFSEPRIISRGGLFQTLLAAPIPRWIAIQHKSSWGARLTFNTSVPRSIECILQTVGGDSGGEDDNNQ